MEKLKKKLSPLILRRRKSDVLKELPPKNEITYFYNMNKEQFEFYNSVKAFYLEKIINSIETKGMNNSRLLIIEGLLRLRQICCHPKLVKFEHVKYKNIKSEKFENLKKLLLTLIKKDSKTVVYSQFVQMLKIIKSWLSSHKIDFEYLDGTTQNRFEKITNFQENENIKIFLLSLKAGGVGINLTSAENVVIYDPWWNPATETQAIDRIHRIGQDKKVFVYKLLMKESVEEKILKLQEKKRNIFDQLFERETALKDLSKEDIQFIFS
jgi:non-specific serine/threonine protein kinase